MKTKYLAVEEPEADINYYRECIIRGTHLYRVASKVTAFRSGVIALNGLKAKRTAELTDGPDPAEEKICSEYRFRGTGKALDKLSSALLSEYDVFDTRVEKDLFRYAVRQYVANVDPVFIGKYQKELLEKYAYDYDALVEALWEESFISDKSKVEAFLAEEHTVNEYLSDPIYRFITEVKVMPFNAAITEAEGPVSITSLDQEYTHLCYEYNLAKA